MKLILAPMATLSHEAFRRSVEGFGGCDEYFTEMINAPSLLNMGPFEKYYLLNGPCPEKIVWQLTGNKIPAMAQAASLVSDIGGIGVDLNMGCCAPQIANSGAGIAWMLRPIEETITMVRGVKSALENAAKDGKKPLRLSVKLRLGDENYTDQGFFSFCDMLVQEGVELLTLHARTKKEKYRGRPRWEYVEKLAKRYEGKIPVILNGEIKDRASLDAALKIAPSAAGVMIARAAAQKPWIFAELGGGTSPAGATSASVDGSSPEGAPAAPVDGSSPAGAPAAPVDGSSPAGAPAAPVDGTSPLPLTIDLLETGLRFIHDVEECQPQEFWKTRLQRFFTYYCLNFSFAHWAQTQMVNAKDSEDSRKRLREYFEKCPDDRFLKIERGPSTN